MVMNFKFTVKFKFLDGFDYASEMVNYLDGYCDYMLFNRNCDDKGYYYAMFTRLCDAKRFVRYLFFEVRYGSFLDDIYIVSFNALYCLHANYGFDPVTGRFYLNYKKVGV